MIGMPKSIEAIAQGYKVDELEINPLFTAEQALRVIDLYREERASLVRGTALELALEDAAVSAAKALQVMSMFVLSVTEPRKDD
jgi:hypothetical protein